MFFKEKNKIEKHKTNLTASRHQVQENVHTSTDLGTTE